MNYLQDPQRLLLSICILNGLTLVLSLFTTLFSSIFLAIFWFIHQARGWGTRWWNNCRWALDWLSRWSLWRRWIFLSIPYTPHYLFCCHIFQFPHIMLIHGLPHSFDNYLHWVLAMHRSILTNWLFNRRRVMCDSRCRLLLSLPLRLQQPLVYGGFNGPLLLLGLILQYGTNLLHLHLVAHIFK